MLASGLQFPTLLVDVVDQITIDPPNEIGCGTSIMRQSTPGV
jgi:hypothetical protein